MTERLMCFLRKLFGRKTKQAAPPAERPPRPADWNLTFADLMAEMKAGKRDSVGQPELDWARDYERSLISAAMRFPQKGDVYEVLQDMEVEFMTAWAAPFTGGGKGMLMQGERVIVHIELSLLRQSRLGRMRRLWNTRQLKSA